jgi:hypothetical protein
MPVKEYFFSQIDNKGDEMFGTFGRVDQKVSCPFRKDPKILSTTAKNYNICNSVGTQGKNL